MDLAYSISEYARSYQRRDVEGIRPMSTYRVAIVGEAFNQEVVNVFHVSSAPGDPTSVATTWVANVQAAYLACLSTAYEINAVVATEIGTNWQHTATTSGSGGITGDCCPLQNAALISWRTGIAGRRYRGRTYLPAVPETAQSGGILSSGHQVLMSQLATALMTTWPGVLTGNLVIYHPDTSAVTPINAYLVREIIYNQRRRTLGVGA